MPKLIEYPRTSYTGAWELAEVVDDTGGKCAIDTAARKLNRKVSGSFKAIIGSGVKFGLMTSKRELLTTTTLFKRIKHAYDKAEEVQFHREAFLTPPLFMQLCRKFRNRELPVQMLDVMLIREFGVEEINAQGVAKAFVDGCRMCGLIDEQNIIADIDALQTHRTSRRELSNLSPQIHQYGSLSKEEGITSTQLPFDSLKASFNSTIKEIEGETQRVTVPTFIELFSGTTEQESPTKPPNSKNKDAIANLFGLGDEESINEYGTQDVQQLENENDKPSHVESDKPINSGQSFPPSKGLISVNDIPPQTLPPVTGKTYQMQMSGPGVNTSLDIYDEDDIAIAMALLEKIRRQLRLHS